MIGRMILLVGLVPILCWGLVSGVTVAVAVRKERRDARRQEIEDRLWTATPAWPAWVDDLSTRERDVLESIVADYLGRSTDWNGAG